MLRISFTHPDHPEWTQVAFVCRDNGGDLSADLDSGDNPIYTLSTHVEHKSGSQDGWYDLNDAMTPFGGYLYFHEEEEAAEAVRSAAKSLGYVERKTIGDLIHNEVPVEYHHLFIHGTDDKWWNWPASCAVGTAVTHLINDAAAVCPGTPSPDKLWKSFAEQCLIAAFG